MIERTLVLVKPDGVQRGLVGRIISRFEDVGLKLVGLKTVWADAEFAKKHYFDIEERRGVKVLNMLVDFMTEGPVVAMAIEGVHAAELVRKMVGATEPKTAAPGTIRGDFSHHSYAYTDEANKAVANLVHASGNSEEAKKEVALWFTPEELHDYKNIREKYTF